MSITKTLFGTSRTIPERKETSWGAQVTGILDDLIDGVEAAVGLSGSTFFVKWLVATSSLAAAASLTATATIHRVQGDSAARTLDTTTPIVAGSNGQLLILMGAHATNTITIEDSGTVDLNGDITLGLGEVLGLIYNTTRSKWEECFRSN